MSTPSKFDRDFVRGEAEKLKAKAQRRRTSSFASVDHLGPEAVAAYVDHELSPVAEHRAKVHMIHCEDCRREVQSQRTASERLKRCCDENVHAPSSLLAKLANIESCCPDGPGADKRDVSPVEQALKKVTQAFKR